MRACELSELNDLPESARERLYQHCRRVAARQPLTCLTCAFAGGTVSATVLLSVLLIPSASIALQLVIHGFVALVLGLLICHVLDIETHRQLRRQRPLGCRCCRYDLRGSLRAGQTACPECGSRVHPVQFHYHRIMRHPDDYTPMRMSNCLTHVRPLAA